MLADTPGTRIFYADYSKKKNDSTAQWMGKQTLITCPAPQGNQTQSFFYLFCNLSRKDKEITQNTDKMEMDSILCSKNEAESVEMLNTLILNTKLSFMVWFSFLSSYLKCSSHDVHSLNEFIICILLLNCGNF